VLLGTRTHDEMTLLYRAADFYVQTSHREGSGYSLLEAMACGTPPIVTDIPPTRFIVDDAGSLTPVGDAPAMAEALLAWAGRDRSLLRLGARARFDAALTFDVIGRQLRGAYESLVEACAS
jgi:glycosyltransferase involved in cell wall biosynthesis